MEPTGLYILEFLQYIQQGLPTCQANSSFTWQLSVWNGGEKYRSSTGNYTPSFPFHLVHFKLSGPGHATCKFYLVTLQWLVAYTKWWAGRRIHSIDGYFIKPEGNSTVANCSHRTRTIGRQLHRMVWKKSSVFECGKTREMVTSEGCDYTPHLYSEAGGGLKVPGCPDQQQTELEDQQWGSM